MIISDDALMPAPIEIDDRDDDDVVFVNEERGHRTIDYLDLSESQPTETEPPIISPARKRRNTPTTAGPSASAATIDISKIPEAYEPPPKQNNGLANCPICLEDKTPYALMCGHIFCKTCIYKSLESKKQCPMCNTKATVKQVHKIFLN